MKGKYIAVLMVMAFALSLASCEIHSSDNGKLDGMWHLVGVDTVNGGHLDMSKQTIFWMFQADLLQVSNSNVGKRIIFRFNQADDSLIVSEPRVNDRTESDTLFTTTTELSSYGINALQESFYIESLKHDKMILRTKRLSLNFKKM